MSKHRTGLQKQVSAIFDGMPIPKNNSLPQLPDRRAPGRSGNVRPEPPVSDQPGPQKAKAQLPSWSMPEANPAKDPKADGITKPFRQMSWQRAWERIRNKAFGPKLGVSTTRQKTMAVLIPLLFIILIFMLIKVFNAPLHRTSSASSFAPTNAIAATDNEIDWQRPAPYPKTLRDPMQPGSASAQADAGGIIVKGILYSQDNPSAIIANQIVHEGEKISGVTIVKINKDSVDFEMNGKSWTQKVQR